MNVEETLIQGLILGAGLVVAEKGIAAVEGFVADKEPEFVKNWNLFYLGAALVLIAIGRKIHKIVPTIGGIMVVLWFAGILKPYVDKIGGGE